VLALLLDDLVPSALPQAGSEMRLWRNTILKKLSNRERCEGWKRKLPTLNVEHPTPN
jgi:hypothetical protein